MDFEGRIRNLSERVERIRVSLPLMWPNFVALWPRRPDGSMVPGVSKGGHLPGELDAIERQVLQFEADGGIPFGNADIPAPRPPAPIAPPMPAAAPQPPEEGPDVALDEVGVIGTALARLSDTNKRVWEWVQDVVGRAHRHGSISLKLRPTLRRRCIAGALLEIASMAGAEADPWTSLDETLFAVLNSVYDDLESTDDIGPALAAMTASQATSFLQYATGLAQGSHVLAYDMEGTPFVEPKS